MIKKVKRIVNRLCIAFVIVMSFFLSAVVIASSAVKNDDMKYSAEIVSADGEVIDSVPIGIGIRGDANSDGKVSVGDAAQVASYLANFSKNKNYMPGYKDSLGGAMADANADGKLNVRDAATIARYLAKKGLNPDADWE